MHYYCLYTTLKAKAADIASLRAQIAPQLGGSGDFWHNHDLASGNTIHRYPLIQYKIVKGCFSLVFIGPAEQELWRFLQLLPIRLRNRKILDFWQMEKIPLRLSLRGNNTYRCNNFLPFDSERFETYKQICAHLSIPANAPHISDPALLSLFEEILKGQLLKQAADLGRSDLHDRLRLQITSRRLTHGVVKFHRTRYSKIGQLEFRTNLHWPLHLGIGKGSSIGFGMLRKT